jgi:hypothetical protein
VANKNKAHQKWKVKQNESFGEVFFSNQDNRSKWGENLPCMKFHIKGHCFSGCTRLHSLSPDQTKSFDTFVASCRSKAAQVKSDFQAGVAIAALVG